MKWITPLLLLGIVAMTLGAVTTNAASDPTLAHLGGVNSSGMGIAIESGLTYQASGQTKFLRWITPPNTLRNSYDVGNTAYDVDTNPTHAFVAAYSAGLKVFSISSGELSLAKTITGLSNVYSVMVCNHLAYVGTSTGLKILDVSDPLQPVILGSLPTATINGVYVDNGLAHLATNNGYTLANVVDPTQPVLLGNWNPGNRYGKSVTAREDIVYLATGSSGLALLDVSNPQAITQTRSISGTVYAVRLHPEERYMLTAGAGLKVYDLYPNPNAPVLAASVDTPNVFGLGLDVDSTGLVALSTDGNASFYQLSGTEPWPEETVTPTPTETLTITPEPTSTDTPTATITPSWTPTDTPTATATWSPTPSSTPTWTPTPTATETWTPTPTQSVTPSSTPTATQTNTPTPTPTDTPSPTPTASVTPTPTDTATPTATVTATPTETGTPTPPLPDLRFRIHLPIILG